MGRTGMVAETMGSRERPDRMGPRTRPLEGIVASGHAELPSASLIASMPKAEVHLHLDGSLRIATALELAASRGIDAPRDEAGMRAALIAPMPCTSQAELLRAFDLPIALMQDAEALERITAELVETKAAEGVRYVEIRWGPLLHVSGGLSLADGIGAVCAGARDAAARTGTVVRLISTALRSHDPVANETLAETAARFQDQGLTGWDLAGPEEAYPDPWLHERAFEIARDAGLRITLHAGEWGGAAPGPAGPVHRPGTDRPRPGRHRRPGPVRGTDRPRRDPGPVPVLELASRDRSVGRVASLWPGSTGWACR